MKQILLLDFGSRHLEELIGFIREQPVGLTVLPGETPASVIAGGGYAGVIFSGGPGHVYTPDARLPDPGIYDLSMPILGICYGVQILAWQLGGTVEPGPAENGVCTVHTDRTHPLFSDMPARIKVYMSHGDYVRHLPEGFRVIAESPTCPVCAMADDTRRFYGVQYHPETRTSPCDTALLRRFLESEKQE